MSKRVSRKKSEVISPVVDTTVTADGLDAPVSNTSGEEEKKVRGKKKKEESEEVKRGGKKGKEKNIPIRDVSLQLDGGGGVSGEEEKNETLILHLPIKSSDLTTSTHPRGIHNSKVPMATYSVDGTYQAAAVAAAPITEETTYDEILREEPNIVEKRDFNLVFGDVMREPTAEIEKDFEKKVKEFKLTQFITTIPHAQQPQQPQEENRDEIYASSCGGVFLSELESGGAGGGGSSKATESKNLFEEEEKEKEKKEDAVASNPNHDILLEGGHLTNRVNKKSLKNILVEFVNYVLI